MLTIDKNKIWLELAIFTVIEILSFLSFNHSLLNQAVFMTFVVATLALTIYDLEYGILIVLGELFIGSLGHLFNLEWGGFSFSIRLSLWVSVMLVFIVQFLRQIIRQKGKSPYWLSWRNFPGQKLFLLLFVFVAISLLNGLWRGHSLSLIFTDFNAWIYFFLLGPILAVYGANDSRRNNRLVTLFFAAALWLSLKTLFLLFIFTHNIGLASEIYLWLRKTLVGEMTPTVTGWPRIFIQGQIYSALVFFIVFWFGQAGLKLNNFFRYRNLGSLLIAGCLLSAVLISFSRSFWVALAGTMFFSLIFVWRSESFKAMLIAGFWFIVSGIFSFIFIYLVVAFPYVHLPAEDFSSNFLARVNSGNNEAALASRWSLLPVLMSEIWREPILGQGYGATVTYFSRDPRILENNPAGLYTTYAFEWGYLDLWLKLGILGLLAYLWLLFRLMRDACRRGLAENNPLFLALSAGILFLLLTHAFTPYLNHPLGIGYLLISSCLIWPNRVY